MACVKALRMVEPTNYLSIYGGQALGHYSRWAPQTSSSRFTRPQLYL